MNRLLHDLCCKILLKKIGVKQQGIIITSSAYIYYDRKKFLSLEFSVR